MSYKALENPFELLTGQSKKRELKSAFVSVMEQKELRVQTISRYLLQVHGLEITPNSTDEEINRLPSMIASLGGLITLTAEQFASAHQRSKPEVIEVMFKLGHTKEPDAMTRNMIFDAALLWGELFRNRYPGAKWELAREPRSSIYYGDPVLISAERTRAEFDPKVDLTGFVCGILLNEPDSWTLTKIMKFRAFDMGLGPEPGPEDQRIW